MHGLESELVERRLGCRVTEREVNVLLGLGRNAVAQQLCPKCTGAELVRELCLELPRAIFQHRDLRGHERGFGADALVGRPPLGRERRVRGARHRDAGLRGNMVDAQDEHSAKGLGSSHPQQADRRIADCDREPRARAHSGHFRFELIVAVLHRERRREHSHMVTGLLRQVDRVLVCQLVLQAGQSLPGGRLDSPEPQFAASGRPFERYVNAGDLAPFQKRSSQGPRPRDRKGDLGLLLRGRSVPLRSPHAECSARERDPMHLPYLLEEHKRGDRPWVTPL
jgi:hypothetical protein